jgi:hypothetical protein
MVLNVRRADNVYKALDWFVNLLGRGATTFSIMTLSIMSSFATLSIFCSTEYRYDTQRNGTQHSAYFAALITVTLSVQYHYTECHNDIQYCKIR